LTWIVSALLVGCVDRPVLPTLDEVPIVASDRCAEPREAVVACVIDGDTVDLDVCGQGERVRLLGIDAPEIEHPPDPAECWGDEADAALAARLTGRRVLLTFDRRCEGVFGRTLAYVWDLDEVETPVNTWLVEQGHARIYDEQFGDTILQPQLIQARDRARTRGLGLWGTCGIP
jgi:micrococcal nuclease